MGADEARDEDTGARASTITTVTTSSTFKLIATGSKRRLPPKLDRLSSRTLLERSQSSSKRHIAGVQQSLLRRPSTASSTHSRIHQALRRSESEFVISSKESTVDGFLYSSRFQQTTTVRPALSQPKTNSKSKQTLKRVSATSPQTQTQSPPRSPSTHQTQSQLLDVSPTVDCSSSSEVSSTTNDSKSGKPRPFSSSHLEQRQRNGHATDSISDTSGAGAAPAPATTLAITRMDDDAYIARKRRCACTFEQMIFARIHGSTQGKDSPKARETVPDGNQSHDEQEASGGIDKLLGNGIITSILALSSLPDAATQAHCCRALYYLSWVPSARKPMVVHGAVATIKSLSRNATIQSRQDLAATLCHLCEESSLVEPMLFEGIDRCLMRLVTSAHPETKRICALAVFNISSDAIKIKHFVETFSQLLITSTKNSYDYTAASSYLMKAVYNVARLPMFHASLLGENIPRFLAAQLPHVSGDIQILALQALVSLCDAKRNRAQILSQGFCQLLEKMLVVVGGEVQEMALLVLLLLSLDEGSRIKLCSWVPMATIIDSAAERLAAHATSSLVFLDSCIMRNMCDSVLTHHELLEKNAMPLLLDMSRAADHSIKANAVCALVSIITSSPEESAEYVTEILNELITLTQSRVPHICLFAVGAVYNIACNDDCLPLLARSSELVARLHALALAPEHDNVAELTAAVIYRLATLDLDTDASIDTPKMLLERGSFPALVQLTRQFPTARGYAIHALLCLARSKLFPHGSEAIWELLCALNNEPLGGLAKSAPATTGEDVIAARSAVALIAALAQQRTNHAVLVRQGAVFRFLRGLRRVARARDASGAAGASTDVSLVMNTAFVFYALAVSQEGCEQLIREQGIEELIHLARTAKFADVAQTHQVKELVMMAMCRVSSFIGLEVKLIEHGAIDAVLVLALVSSADSIAIKSLCIKTLANCLVAKNCARPLIEHGVIWALASLAVVDSPETRSACAVSLCNLATVPHMLARFLDAGAPRALVQLLQKSERESTTALVVVKAIANLVANEKICLALVNEDVEKHLGAYFASAQSSTEMRQLAAMVLLRVASANDAVISLEHLKHGVFVWMEQIITMENDALVKNCMLTVYDLTCSMTVDVAELDVDHILRIVIQVFQRHTRRSDVLTLCLWILYNLSCQLSVLHELVRPEILAFLRRQVPTVALPFPLPFASTETSVTHLAVSASMLTLMNGAATPSLDVKLCCYILHNLSCAIDGTHDVLAKLVNARTVSILSDVYLQRDDLKETCAVAVCSLAVGRVNSTRVVDDRAGDLVSHFVFSALFHRCHYHLVSVAIRKMVNAPGNQPLLLHRGVVHSIVHVLELLADDSAAELVTTRNLIASLCVLSKCKSHLSRLLQDGALPVVIAVSERKVLTTGSGGLGSEILGYCFEILSELCSVDFEAFATRTIPSSEEINVIDTLTRLSELHQVMGNSSAAAAALSYYNRGEDAATSSLAAAQLLTYMKKLPASSNSLKKTLELQATFQVPARKWIPDAQPSPLEPPPLECGEIPLTEGSQSMPDEIKKRINALASLPKEPLRRDENVEAEPVESNSAQAQADAGGGVPTLQEETHPARTALRGRGAPPMLMGSRHAMTTRMQLQRGLAGRNLSLASASPLLV